MTKLERLARDVVTASATNRFIGAKLQRAIDELGDFLDYLAEPARGAPELMIDRSCAACGRDLTRGNDEAIKLRAQRLDERFELPSPRDSDAPELVVEEPCE